MSVNKRSGLGANVDDENGGGADNDEDSAMCLVSLRRAYIGALAMARLTSGGDARSILPSVAVPSAAVREYSRSVSAGAWLSANSGRGGLQEMGDDRWRKTDEACDELGGLMMSVLRMYLCSESEACVVWVMILSPSSMRVSGSRSGPSMRPVRKRRWSSRS